MHKGNAVRAVLEQHGLEISPGRGNLHFGDGMNDFEMLSMTKGRGVVMATPMIAPKLVPCQSTNRPSLPMKMVRLLMTKPASSRNPGGPNPASGCQISHFD